MTILILNQHGRASRSQSCPLIKNRRPAVADNTVCVTPFFFSLASGSFGINRAYCCIGYNSNVGIGSFPEKLLSSFIVIHVINTNAFSRKPQYLTFKVSFRYSLTPPEVLDLITGLHLGVDTIIICFKSSPKQDQSDTAMTYLVGLKNPILHVSYVCNLVGKELSQHIIATPKFIKRRGWNAVCAVFPERNCHILLWGISSEEFIARQYASSHQVSLYKAKAIINGACNRGNISVHSPHSPTHSPTADGAASSNIPIPKILFYLTLYVPSHVLLKGASHFALKLVSFLKK